MEPGGGGGGGEVATKRPKQSSDASAGSEDHLLPDDILVLILRHLPTAAAARTSVLSHRWRRIWALLPELRFPSSLDPHQIGLALQLHKAALQHLSVLTRYAGPDSVAAWLPVAARRLSGRFVFINEDAAKEGGEEEEEEEEEQGGAFELPCFGKATAIYLGLRSLGVAMPQAGIFARLTELSLLRVRLHGPCELGDVISSPRCPCLQKLCIYFVWELNNLAIHSGSLLRVELWFVWGLNNLAIHSGSLLRVELDDLGDLQQLTIVTPVLEYLQVSGCIFNDENQQAASISAPQLVFLYWSDPYDPSSVDLGKMERVQRLSTSDFLVYGPNNLAVAHNRGCVRLLERFKVVEDLILTLKYFGEIENFAYLMDDMTVLPDITFLKLNVLAYGHAFGASAFHVLRLCSGIRRLKLFLAPTHSEAQSSCPSVCICGQQASWKTEEVSLNRLEEVEITGLRGSENEFAFLKRLLSWAALLKTMTIYCDNSVAEKMANELRQMLRSFSRTEVCMKVYTYEDMIKALCEKSS